MNLKDYIRDGGNKTRLIAEACGVTPPAVRHWANGIRRCPPDLETIEAIEEATGGSVTRHDLRPDVFGGPDNSRAA